MSEPIIETVNVQKYFTIGEVVTRAVDGVSIQIHEGEFVAIDGRSGSGKSTLLHLLSLLDQPSAGEVRILREDTSRFSRAQRVAIRLTTFGYVFQDYALIPELTALENVLLPHFMQTGCYRSCSQQGETLLARVGLGERLHNLPSQLSGGEQQRVAIARALVNKPRILFADEPTANLDTDTGETIMSIIAELHTQGLTVLMVTHEPEYAARAERLITLTDGRVVK
ncbi:MAG: ABC transporter ATP-binding protein [Candidatus Pacebacteria bacterium]|nr:ABC transporter ATP-binding protein [Candidatus Paceibacterota bacterium]